MNTLAVIKEQIENNTILLYMKGTPKFPQCGFSSQAVQAVMECGGQFAYINVLENPNIRSELPSYADWPTFPQLWIKGELVGGCDIIMELSKTGELKRLITDGVTANSSLKR